MGRQIPRSTYNQPPGPAVDTKPYVVVIFGRTGVGISSLVNLITGHPVSLDHANAKPTTPLRPQPHPPIKLDGSDKEFILYEIPGFVGSCSDPDRTLLEMIREIDQRAGIDLFLYCLRKQKATVMPEVVRRVRETEAGREVPLLVVVTELERFAPEGDMEEWWGSSEDGMANGAVVEQMCLGEEGFDGHVCVTTLPRRDVDLVERLRKRREVSEGRIRRAILAHCAGDKREASDPLDARSQPCNCLTALFSTLGF